LTQDFVFFPPASESAVTLHESAEAKHFAQCTLIHTQPTSVNSEHNAHNTCSPRTKEVKKFS